MKSIVLMAILFGFVIYAQDISDQDTQAIEHQRDDDSNEKDTSSEKESTENNAPDKSEKSQNKEKDNPDSKKEKNEPDVKSNDKQKEDTKNGKVNNAPDKSEKLQNKEKDNPDSKKEKNEPDDKHTKSDKVKSEQDAKNNQPQQEDSRETSNNTNQRKSIVVIGKLMKTVPLTLKKPSEYALEDDNLYKSVDYYVGNLFIHSRKKRELSHLEGKVVMVNGYLDKDLNKIIEKIGPCPEDYGKKESHMQIRSDWVNEETGFSVGRSTTEKLRKVSFLRYFKIKECKSFRVKKYLENEKVEIVFRNELRKSISNLVLVAKYESVFGKPVPMHQDKKIKKLSPGDKASFVIPMTISSIKKYKLHSVEVQAENGRFHIDIAENIEQN